MVLHAIQIFALLCKYCWKKCINFGSYQILYLSRVIEYKKKRPFFYNICTTMQIFDVVRPVWVLFGLLAILCKYLVLNLKISTSCANIVYCCKTILTQWSQSILIVMHFNTSFPYHHFFCGVALISVSKPRNIIMEERWEKIIIMMKK